MKRFLSVLLVVLALPLAVRAVDMPLQDIHGNRVNISSYQGKWLVVNYWATWCPPCIVEMPELQSFHDAHVDKDAMVLGINTELIGKQRLQDFLEDYFITYPVFTSKPAQQSELGLIPGLPTTFLVSPQGDVVARQVGPVTREMIEQFIQNWQPQLTSSQ
ncbi:MAG: TlpA family protein disulfide reductase [Gammaproteobacteria bacterium]|nr:TlpA family protein disulfide reductase [Gammaproteobacteria bacterium]